MGLAIKSLYNGVKCSVRINSFSTDCFSVTCSLKQICPLSPLLFNIFINELTVYLKSFDLGIDIGGEKACILLYAYDIVLLADTESDLQNLLDRLCTWCNNNNMTINACTNNVVHCRLPSMERSKYIIHI
jgi:hypothetical protein